MVYLRDVHSDIEVGLLMVVKERDRWRVVTMLSAVFWLFGDLPLGPQDVGIVEV